MQNTLLKTKSANNVHIYCLGCVKYYSQVVITTVDYIAQVIKAHLDMLIHCYQIEGLY